MVHLWLMKMSQNGSLMVNENEPEPAIPYYWCLLFKMVNR